MLAAQPGQPALAVDGDDRQPVRMSRRPPAPGLAELVRHVWIPRWRLPPGASVAQRVLEYPSTNLVVESGDRRAIVHGPSPGMSTRALEGDGWAFGVLLQPGTARALLGIAPRELIGRSAPVSAPGAERMAAGVAASIAGGDDDAAIATFERWLGGLGLEPAPRARLVRELVARAEDDRGIVRVEQLAEIAGTGVRRLERLVREELGLTPKWLIRRYRLQEASARLAEPGHPPLAELAASIGYADQAHFTREFRTVIGVPPGRYAREARAER
ncbi:helix-turn-helix domain-containing protein [Agromyces archimandritae]|uniref:Helix-turn-helix domain-containing protein n=1 Tax=Agromyces archimandritae TaxID=2781962 RepID=A0A975FKX1_9MICO|nr:helix-turn-helix domain-containing protein [Agromyces archimandritae]QTX03807.1 helix-turn-helix domain-containing protein [Agromyces archimandritae]